MTKHKKKPGKRLTTKDLQIALLRYLLAHPNKQFSPRQLCELLKVENNKDSVAHGLRSLVEAGSAIELKEGKYAAALNRLVQIPDDDDLDEDTSAGVIPPQADRYGARGEVGAKFQREEKGSPREQARRGTPQRKQIEGTVDLTRTGAAYVVNDTLDSDVYIPVRHVNGALHGDRVRVMLFPMPPQRRGRPERKPEGEIISVIQRASEFFLATLRLSRNYALAVPDNPNMPVDIYVPNEAIGPGRDGDSVVVRITDWQEGKGRMPIGKVTQVLGKAGGNDFEMKRILINAGFELSHSEAAEAESAAIPDTISPLEIERRRDFRDILTFTIDPEDAKDFDDAISLRKLDDGNLEIGVHIADVTHFLRPDTPLDREAYQRSTSVYLVDRCLPMLPEKLSNNLCSLVPNQDRLCFSAVFAMDDKGKIKQRWFGKTVIHSAKRFSYEEAQTILDGEASNELLGHELYPQLHDALHTLDRIAKKMRKEREKAGAIGFDTQEVRFRLTPDGTPIEAYVKERRDTHLLIEDFMLLANREVATAMSEPVNGKQPPAFIYRVHDQPDMERVAEFARFAYEMGHPMKVDTPQQIAKAFNDLMRATKTDERLKLLEPLAIRTMAKAIYTTQNIGHYGLAFEFYTHFTSPIRRYSDVLVHRLLEQRLSGSTLRYDTAKLEEKCKHISSQEKKAADAERESTKMKQAELVSRQIGTEQIGTISGMIERGMFVMLDGSQAEGMIEFRYLDDSYVVEEGRLRARGKRYKRVFRMGDRVRVRIASVDIAKRQIEMDLLED
jgi:ribonuclease R